EADPNLLRYALANLIDNALKYSRRRPRAEIKIDLADGHSHEREAVIYVQDNGDGFDMAHAKRLFSPFQRLHNSKDYEGSGIGLASGRRIIQRPGGRVWFESEPNKGATFYFTLARTLAMPDVPRQEPVAVGNHATAS